MRKITTSLFIFVLGLFVMTACDPQITRIDPNETTDLSGRWNDTDSRLVAQEMINSSLTESWLRRFREANGKEPVVIVGGVINKSHEHIEATTFIKDIEREYVKSGLVRVVQNSQLREKIREERADQQDFADPATAKKFGKELGADYMLFVYINSIVDEEGRTKMIFYKVNMELANMETNELVWIGDKEIKKIKK